MKPLRVVSRQQGENKGASVLVLERPHPQLKAVLDKLVVCGKLAPHGAWLASKE